MPALPFWSPSDLLIPWFLQSPPLSSSWSSDLLSRGPRWSQHCLVLNDSRVPISPADRFSWSHSVISFVCPLVFNVPLVFKIQVKDSLPGPMQAGTIPQPFSQGRGIRQERSSPKWWRIYIYSFRYCCIIYRPPESCPLFLEKFSTWFTISLSDISPVIIFG